MPRADQVEPDIAEYLASPLASFDDFAATTAPQVREHFAKLRTATEVPDVAEVTDASFAGPSGPVPVRIYRAALDRPAPAILWFHGGGWVLGNLDTAELPVRTLCAQTGCTVISVDYSLAPEAPFPAAFDDCAASLAWLRETAADLAVDPDRIIVGGDSAGGNLAAAIATAERDAGRALLGQLLIYPVVEPPSPDGYGETGSGYGLTESALHWFWDQYLSDPEDRADRRANLTEAELASTPPAYVLTCGFDPLAAEGLRFASSLEEAGVPVVADHLLPAIHGVFAMDVSTGRQARAAASAWVVELLDDGGLERS